MKNLIVYLMGLLFLSGCIRKDDSYSYVSPGKSIIGAVEAQNLKGVQAALQTKVSIHERDKDGWTALHWAAALPNKKILDVLLHAGLDVNSRDNDGFTPLMHAIANKQVDNVSILLEQGSDLNQRAYNNASAFGMAVVMGQLPLIDLLLKYGSNPNELIAGESVLAKSIAKGYAPIALVLIDHGADVNIMDAQKVTPLMLAVAKNLEDVIKALLAKGANVDPINWEGKKAIDYAKNQSIKRILV